MTWVKLDDGILDNDKIAQVGALGFAVHVAGIVHCGRNLTDGFISYGAARRLLDFEFVQGEEEQIWEVALTSGASALDGDKVIPRVIEWLTYSMLWDRVFSGYQVHDYLKYNPSREEVLAERAKKQAAGQAGGRASAQARAQAPATAQSKQPPSSRSSITPAKSKPVPVPVPVPQTSEDNYALAPRNESVDFVEFYEHAYPRKAGRGAARAAWFKALKVTDSTTILEGARRFRLDPNRDEAFTPHPATWLNQERWTDDPEPARSTSVRHHDRAAEILKGAIREQAAG